MYKQLDYYYSQYHLLDAYSHDFEALRESPPLVVKKLEPLGLQILRRFTPRESTQNDDVGDEILRHIPYGLLGCQKTNIDRYLAGPKKFFSNAYYDDY